MQAHLQAFLQRQDYQIIALNSSKKKVDKHNNLVERVYLIEQHEAVNDNKIKTAEHRIADLENEQNKERKI